MNIKHETIQLNTTKQVELINITYQINKIIDENNISDGLVNISTKHTTTSIIINEDEEGLKKDMINLYEKLIPYDNFFHDKIDNNARSHLKSLLLQSNQTLPISEGHLDLGTWQSVFFVEFDGPRNYRTITITLLY